MSQYGAASRYLGEAGERYFREYTSTGGDDTPFLNASIWRPHVDSSHDILDFGCGSGSLLRGLPGRRKIGVDINPAARAAASRVGTEVHGALDEVVGRFDRVISAHAIEHVPSPALTLEHLRSFLRDGDSRLLLLLPLEDWRRRDQRSWDGNDLDQHLYAWTPLALGNLLTQAGYTVRAVHIVQHAWPPAARHLVRISRPAYERAAWVWSGLTKQRQLFAEASLR